MIKSSNQYLMIKSKLVELSDNPKKKKKKNQVINFCCYVKGESQERRIGSCEGSDLWGFLV